ncbi:hypothetical protein H2204_011088 [Knufia peltigerae]|uniref:C2H2-type domain-containing protein n=1 Tax=Knufia peltigerae TaxID=1002370 RepID=A0AA39CUC5_9EURO|nr:hypothetical protein H2204_011088 [Knufia peltigerae]
MSQQRQQPFQCHVCHSRFTRNENLKRHSALHSRSQASPPSHVCDYCTATFSRADLQRRHVKKMHLERQDFRRSTTKRLRQDTTSTALIRRRGEPDNAQRRRSCPRQQQTLSASLSPSESPCSKLTRRTQSNDDYGSLPQVDYYSARERPHLPQDEQLGIFHHGIIHQYNGEDGLNAVATVASPTSVGGDDSSSIDTGGSAVMLLAEPTHISQPVFHATDDVEQSLRLGSLSSTSSPSQFQNNNLNSHHATSTSPPGSISQSQQQEEDWSPSPAQIGRGVHQYFKHISNFFPFLHQPTFDIGRTPDFLILSMLSLAYQYDEDPDYCGGDAAFGSGARLSARCFHRARVLLLESSNESTKFSWSSSLTMIQAYLLLQVCAMMYLCGEDSAHGLQMHSKMIFLARSGGLMLPCPTPAGASEDLGSLWREFVTAESHKRTLFALHQVDALWYQFLSIPRSLSHLEIKHDLPCPEDCWAATSSAQWAHRRLLLVARHTTGGQPMQYGDAVRRFLSADHPDIDSIPDFDAYGAVNVAQFLISSVREISGWLTMTGRLSIERLEPLRSSLEAFRPLLIRQNQVADAAGGGGSKGSTLCEATWQMAMIELQTWSPAHTGGIVGGSVDALLQESTHLAPSCEFLVETDTARSIQPHIDWFLCQLDNTTPVPGSEPPWVLLYAYKAFLIAWRLVCGASVGAMQVVGVADGDVEGAMRWARKVFEHRQRWRLGRMILTCLDGLAN